MPFGATCCLAPGAFGRLPGRGRPPGWPAPGWWGHQGRGPRACGGAAIGAGAWGRGMGPGVGRWGQCGATVARVGAGRKGRHSATPPPPLLPPHWRGSTGPPVGARPTAHGRERRPVHGMPGGRWCGGGSIIGPLGTVPFHPPPLNSKIPSPLLLSSVASPVVCARGTRGPHPPSAEGQGGGSQWGHPADSPGDGAGARSRCRTGVGGGVGEHGTRESGGQAP